jgi:hypothetical protein
MVVERKNTIFLTVRKKELFIRVALIQKILFSRLPTYLIRFISKKIRKKYYLHPLILSPLSQVNLFSFLFKVFLAFGVRGSFPSTKYIFTHCTTLFPFVFLQLFSVCLSVFPIVFIFVGSFQSHVSLFIVVLLLLF